ncbi:putative carbohydrate phosphorylase [Actinomycetales bacterium JB111]|nr:putative carbohydrate phosphorylase [Actinomycetales bacterium JB111]
MNLLVTPVVSVLIGLFVRSRLLAAILYLSIAAILFTFQTLTVLLVWLGGEGGFGGSAEQGAFGPGPTGGLPLQFDEGELWAYGLVNVGILLVGVALTILVVTLRNRSRAKHADVTAA